MTETKLNEPVPIGEPLEAIIGRLGTSIKQLTPQQRAERERNIKDQRIASGQARATELMTVSCAPKRQRDNTNLDRTGEWEKTRATVAAKLGSGFIIALVGTRGCGKTQIGVELIRQLSQDFKRSKFCSAMEFFMRIKAGYRDDGDPEEKVIAEFAKPALLVIDEIGQRSENDWENRLLYELINRRYNAVLDTLVISNQEVGQLEASIGPSLVSRMRETGGVVECNWQSYRR